MERSSLLFHRRLQRFALYSLAMVAGCIAACTRSNTASPASDQPSAVEAISNKLRAAELVIVDLAGEAISLSDGRPTAVVVMRTDCPIAQRYAPKIARMISQFADQGATFRLIFPVETETNEEIEQFAAEFGLPSQTIFRDPGGSVTLAIGARVTPEAFVFDADGAIRYRGRIDDRHVDFGKSRAAPESDDLVDALQAVIVGREPAVAVTKAVGCYLPPQRSHPEEQALEE